MTPPGSKPVDASDPGCDAVRDGVRRHYREVALAVQDACATPGSAASLPSSECSTAGFYEQHQTDELPPEAVRAFEGVKVELTHQVAPGLIGAIVRAIKPKFSPEVKER